MINRAHGLSHEDAQRRTVTISLYPHPLVYAESDWDATHPVCEAVYEQMIDRIESLRDIFKFSYVASLGIHDRHSPRVYVEVVIRGYDAREVADRLKD